MVNKSRFLTDEEINIIKGGYIDWLQKSCGFTDIEAIEKALRAGLPREVAKAEHSKTLKAVGEWLSIRWTQYEENVAEGIFRTTFKMSKKQWESLKRGEMPE
jgi:hypothetical protein